MAGKGAAPAVSYHTISMRGAIPRDADIAGIKFDKFFKASARDPDGAELA